MSITLTKSPANPRGVVGYTVDLVKRCCAPCGDGEHADDGTGTPCRCCGARPAFDVVGFVIAAESGDLSPMEYLEGLGHLVRSGMIWNLQGSWQRAAISAIDGGLVDSDTGNLTDYAIEVLGANLT